MKILMRSVVTGVVSLPHRAALQDPWNRTHTSLSTRQPLAGLRIVSQEVMGAPGPRKLPTEASKGCTQLPRSQQPTSTNECKNTHVGIGSYLDESWPIPLHKGGKGPQVKQGLYKYNA